MEQEELIIWVYLWVCEETAALQEQWPKGRIRRGGYAPALSDEEALTIELCGEMFRHPTDKSIVGFFQTHYRSWFPHLKDRSAFARQVASLWQVKQQLAQRLLHAHQVQEAYVQSVDTLPLPVCAKARRHRDRVFKGVAALGFCAAKDLFYYGFKLGLRVCERGFIVHHALLDAPTNDCRHLPTLVEGMGAPCALADDDGVRLVPVDKGFFDPTAWRILIRQGAHIVGRGPKKVDKHRPLELRLSSWLEKMCAQARKRVEVVGALLCGRFALDHIRVHDLWHFEHRLNRKILAFNLLVAANLTLGKPPLDLDGLVRD